MVAFQLDKTLSEFGGVNRGFCQFDSHNLLLSIDECHDIKRVVSDDEQKITGQFNHLSTRSELQPNSLTSMNCWRFTTDIFSAIEVYISKAVTDNNKESTTANVNRFECYLPAVVMQQIAQENKKVKLLTSTDNWFGLTFPEDTALVEKNIANLHQEKAFATLVS